MELQAALAQLQISESTFHRRLRRAGLREGDRIHEGHVTPRAARILGLTADVPALSPPDFREWAAAVTVPNLEPEHDPKPEPTDAYEFEALPLPAVTAPQAAETAALQDVIEAQRAEIAILSHYIEGCDTLLGEMVRTIAEQEDRIRRLEALAYRARAVSPLSGVARLFRRVPFFPEAA